MNEQERAEVDRIAADDRSGASELVQAAAALLLSTARRGGDLREVAAACVAAQPSMAGMLTLEAALADGLTPVASVERFQAQLRRAPTAVARHAVPLLLLGAAVDPSGRPALTIVTYSASGLVKAALLALAREATVRVCCAEGRPRLEGAALAAALAQAAHLEVELFTDAGISAVVRSADAVLVGADAVGDTQFVNKVGTAALCALAAHCGVPVYVLASREKRLTPSLFARLADKGGDPGGILLCGSIQLVGPPVTLRNPYFEHVPLMLASYLVTDAGVISL